MFRWKTTQNILNIKNDGEYFDENWGNYKTFSKCVPPKPVWKNERPIKFEDVDIWEVILEETGLTGVYAAWCPYAEYYIVMKNWTIIAEFEGYMANERLEQFLIENNIQYPKTDNSPTSLQNMTIEKKLILPMN